MGMFEAKERDLFGDSVTKVSKKHESLRLRFESSGLVEHPSPELLVVSVDSSKDWVNGPFVLLRVALGASV